MRFANATPTLGRGRLWQSSLAKQVISWQWQLQLAEPGLMSSLSDPGATNSFTSIGSAKEKRRVCEERAYERSHEMRPVNAIPTFVGTGCGNLLLREPGSFR
jgi:hypothetical protein